MGIEGDDLKDVEGDENYFEELEEVNKKLRELVQILIDHIKGDSVEYQYKYGEGWTVQEHNSMKKQLETEDPEEQLEVVEELIKNYQIDR